MIIMERIKIKCFTFETIEQAEQAIDLINEVQGLPTSEVESYCKWQMVGDYIAIIHDEVVEGVLGATWVEIELEIEEM